MPMQRREFLTHLGCAAASTSLLVASTARAQQQTKVWRVGIILAGTRTLAIEGFVRDLARVGLLLNPEISDYTSVLADAGSLAKNAGVALISADAHNPDSLSEAFAQFSRQGVEALIVVDDAYFLNQRDELAGLA